MSFLGASFDFLALLFGEISLIPFLLLFDVGA
jgi:hypothetical protein